VQHRGHSSALRADITKVRANALGRMCAAAQISF